MMATTHALAGVAVAAATLLVAPEYAPVAAPAALAGGVFPDFDLYAGHRKTLHFPVYYAAATPLAGALALLAPGPATVALSFFLLAAALHSVMDVFGGGLELEPWLATSDRAVYDHFGGRWIPPRRWVRFDGAPEDFALAVALGLPSLYLYEGVVRDLVVAALAVSGAYALARKRLAPVWRRLAAALPARVRQRLPDRFVDHGG